MLDGGAEMLDSTMLVQDLTAEEMLAYSVTVQVAPPPPAAVVVVVFVVEVFVVVVKVVWI